MRPLRFGDLKTAWRLVLSMKPWSYICLEIGLFSNNYSNHPRMCVLSTLCGNVDKDSPFDIYTCIYSCICTSYETFFEKCIRKATPAEIGIMRGHLAFIGICTIHQAHFRRSLGTMNNFSKSFVVSSCRMWPNWHSIRADGCRLLRENRAIVSVNRLSMHALSIPAIVILECIRNGFEVLIYFNNSHQNDKIHFSDSIGYWWQWWQVPSRYSHQLLIATAKLSSSKAESINMAWSQHDHESG